MTKLDQHNAKAPSHSVYFVKERQGEASPDWVKVGVAWANADGQGVNLALTNLGQTVYLTVRPNKPRSPDQTPE